MHSTWDISKNNLLNVAIAFLDSWDAKMEIKITNEVSAVMVPLIIDAWLFSKLTAKINHDRIYLSQ